MDEVKKEKENKNKLYVCMHLRFSGLFPGLWYAFYSFFIPFLFYTGLVYFSFFASRVTVQKEELYRVVGDVEELSW